MLYAWYHDDEMAYDAMLLMMSGRRQLQLPPYCPAFISAYCHIVFALAYTSMYMSWSGCSRP